MDIGINQNVKLLHYKRLEIHNKELVLRINYRRVDFIALYSSVIRPFVHFSVLRYFPYFLILQPIFAPIVFSEERNSSRSALL